jgi:hypothetical protein
MGGLLVSGYDAGLLCAFCVMCKKVMHVGLIISACPYDST